MAPTRRILGVSPPYGLACNLTRQHGLASSPTYHHRLLRGHRWRLVQDINYKLQEAQRYRFEAPSLVIYGLGD
ncbi:hypothetical protein OsJ_26773 [Oryza sativa Japonica Group]|uniref:Uncharacterized protein n=1 Tax=Oryza sativa subsp. japonica TaxID=39947 RepID=B9G046_ORYSJ|nr:hypothetical protein OsJ_26773 [Oryza sativa Japonica Group]